MPRTLRSTMVSQSSPRSARMASPCSLNSGARPAGAGSSSNCTGAATSRKATPSAVSQSCTYPLATVCGSAAASSVSWTTVHWPTKSARRSRHSLEGPLGERVAQDLDGFGAVGHERRVVGEARVGGELGSVDDLAHGRPVLAGLEAGERQEAPVLGQVVADEGVGPEPAGRRSRHRDVHQQRQRHRLAHRPEAGAEQRHVDDGRLAGALAVEERAHDPAGDRHRADRVAEAGTGRAGHVVVVGPLDPEGDARPTPERERVVGALVGVGSARALTRAPHVDDLRVVRPDVVDVDLAASRARPAACS